MRETENPEQSRVIRLKVAERIRHLRKEKGYTQEQLAALSGVDYKHIQLLESKNPSSPRVETIYRLCTGFEISISEFFCVDHFHEV